MVHAGDSATRPSLLLRVRDPADAPAWQSFVDSYGPLVYGYCRTTSVQHADAEDVTQEVFSRLSTAMRDFVYRPDVARFRTWLFTVVRNEINRFQKKKQRGQETSSAMGLAEAVGPEDSAWVDAFNAHILRLALDRSRPHFEPETWRAFEMVWLENRLSTETAQELGRELDWVYVAKSRVLSRVWQEVVELADDSVLSTTS